MRKVLLMCTSLFFLVSVAYAANFQPTPLKLSAPAKISYQFDGKRLGIPFDVTGTPAGVILCVYTTGKAASVSKIRNGFLGWHYMNKVDTSVYFSKLANYETGKNNIIYWDGKGKDGNIVPAGDYTYYLWGYNNKSAREPVCKFINIPSSSGGTQAKIQEIGPDGKGLANPLFFSPGGRIKWTIGNNPFDSLFVETTTMSLGTGWSRGNVIALQPNNFNYFYVEVGSPRANNVKGVRKMQWVPNGESQYVTTWGVNGMTSWASGFDVDPGCITDGDIVYTIDQSYHDYSGVALSDFISIDATDGSIIKKVNMTSFWTSVEGKKAGGQMNGGPNGFEMRNGYIFLNCHCSCMKTMVDPAAENAGDFFVWSNENGDGIFDKNYQPDAVRKWVCHDYIVQPEVRHFSADSNLFGVGGTYDLGAISFGLLGPDGTGIGYYAYAGETATGIDQGRWNIHADYNSPFDGLYTDNYSTGDITLRGGLWYIAQDSIKGMISNNVGVQETAPSAFALSQNTPNPFNPTTTISFIIPKAGNVTVEVFNVSGQKVDTVVNTYMEAGGHSVTWNAMRHSAGMYFYTVKTKDASKTMKMTLLK
ncbi:MAG: T9SS type A sorting domain-containing protein [Candidatus Latescibacter sp.]|nr:T9SS type A sorting domain-containing protein [Candidatus Latescibacter sp.]